MTAPTTSLALAFTQALADQGRAAPDDPRALEPLLDQIVKRAQDRWPGVDADAADFLRAVARRLPEDTPLGEALEATDTDDLYLAFACTSGNRAALLAFERAFLGDVGAYVAAVDSSPAFADEVRQALRDKLFTSQEGEPKIAEYSGRGALGGWVRVTALRAALNLRRGAKRAAAADRRASIETALTSELSPDLAYLKERYRDAFAEALGAAVAGLSDRDRALLRLYHVDGLSLEAMAALYRVHLSTVSRWLTCARESVAEATSSHVRDRLGVDRSEVDSIAALVMSQIDVSLTRLLGGAR